MSINMRQKSKHDGMKRLFSVRGDRVRSIALSLLFLWVMAAAPAWAAHHQATDSGSGSLEIKGNGAPEQPAIQVPSKRSTANGVLSETGQGITEIFSSDLALSISLGDVLALVIVVNVLALFNKPRFIMAVSYFFCLKWVFWSNYKELFGHSDSIATASSFIFVLCGILTTVLFVMDRFNSRNT